MPFFHLKYQFAQMPMSLAALKRVNSIFEMESQEAKMKELQNLAAMKLSFLAFLLATISRGFYRMYRLRSARMKMC